MRNTKLLSNISFFVLALNISAWAVSNFLTEADVPIEVNSLFNKLAYLFGFFCVVSIVVFCYNFPVHIPISRLKATIFTSITVIISLLSLTPLIAGDVSRDSSGLHFTVGSLSTLYVVAFLAFLTAGAVRLLKTRKHSGYKRRQQILLVLIGFIVSVILGLIMNVVLPTIFDDFQTAKFGPLLTVVLVATTTYAIVKHGLFNIRLVIARSVTYLALIATFASVYSIVVFGIAYTFINEDSVLAREVIPVALAIFLVLTGPYLKQYFDKVTNRIFYRDAYDPQVFLDQLNKAIINNIELSTLLRRAAQVIESNLKCEYVLFSVFEDVQQEARYLGTTKKTLDHEEMLSLRKLVLSSQKVIDVDTVEARHPKLYAMLIKNDIAVLTRLVSSLGAGQTATAYMLLGPKKSGNRYNQQDLRVIEIVADELVVAIQNALRFEEIQNFNITLQEKVNNATRKLRTSNEKLKELDETKDDFISMASHQLRTPLTSVKGYLSMVLEGDAGKVTARQRKMLEQAFVSSQRMTYLISDLLNVSRLKTGKFVIERAPTNLVTMVQQELDQLTEAAKGRNLTLVFKPPKVFPDLMLDETKTRQIIMNFVDNAIYYTPAGGTIEIKIADNEQSVEFLVVDSGLGVPKRDQPHLFTKFYRANNARKARPDGTGLGLFMAKKVIVAQGGAIIFTSQEGKGSIFGFTFPKTRELINAN